MSRWNRFDYNKEDIPQTPFEAAVFLQRAASHIEQGANPPGGYLTEINKAHNAVNKTFMEDTMAVQK